MPIMFSEKHKKNTRYKIYNNYIENCFKTKK